MPISNHATGLVLTALSLILLPPLFLGFFTHEMFQMQVTDLYPLHTLVHIAGCYWFSRNYLIYSWLHSCCEKLSGCFEEDELDWLCWEQFVGAEEETGIDVCWTSQVSQSAETLVRASGHMICLSDVGHGSNSSVSKIKIENYSIIDMFFNVMYWLQCFLHH